MAAKMWKSTCISGVSKAVDGKKNEKAPKARRRRQEEDKDQEVLGGCGPWLQKI